MRNSDHRTFVYLRKRHDGRLYFRAIDVEAASDNHVLLAVHNVDETIIVYVADVPRMVPSMCPDFSGRFRHFVIAGCHQSPAGYDFSRLIWRKNLSFVIHDGQTHRGSW